MLLPGISGSFMLLILGKYACIIDAPGAFDIGVISAFALGALSLAGFVVVMAIHRLSPGRPASDSGVASARGARNQNVPG